jgi:hypothetical protein
MFVANKAMTGTKVASRLWDFVFAIKKNIAKLKMRSPTILIFT